MEGIPTKVGMLAPASPDETPKGEAGIASAERRLWEFYSPIVCRLIGLSFDEKGLIRTFKNVPKVQFEDSWQLAKEPQLHGILVQMCSKPNQVSKYVDKVLRKRFEPYRKSLEGLGQEDICKLIEEGNGPKDVPLEALIWLAVRNQHEEVDEIESRIFSAVHHREHRALRLYDALSRVLPDGRVENVLQELKKALASNEGFHRRYERSELKKEQLRSEIETSKKDKFQLAQALTEQRQLNKRLSKDLEKLGGEPSLEQIEGLKGEIVALTEEVKALTEELVRRDFYEAPPEFGKPLASLRESATDKLPASSETEEEQGVSPPLEGVKVGFVGGMKSLVPYYKQTVECLGGVFYNHCEEKSSLTKGEMQRLVEKADVVFCPVDMNSHGACRYVKNACKYRNKPCCFLRSSSLSMFRRELLNFAKNSN
jgi:hypothetical protein